MSIPTTFFFCQAEDGIRDGRVTGVQTCALPILSGGQDDTLADVPADRPVEVGRDGELIRSEERRVGEEGRSRWSPDHLKKQKKMKAQTGGDHTSVLWTSRCCQSVQWV